MQQKDNIAVMEIINRKSRNLIDGTIVSNPALAKIKCNGAEYICSLSASAQMGQTEIAGYAKMRGIESYPAITLQCGKDGVYKFTNIEEAVNIMLTAGYDSFAIPAFSTTSSGGGSGHTYYIVACGKELNGTYDLNISVVTQTSVVEEDAKQLMVEVAKKVGTAILDKKTKEGKKISSEGTRIRIVSSALTTESNFPACTEIGALFIDAMANKEESYKALSNLLKEAKTRATSLEDIARIRFCGAFNAVEHNENREGVLNEKLELARTMLGEGEYSLSDVWGCMVERECYKSKYKDAEQLVGIVSVTKNGDISDLLEVLKEPDKKKEVMLEQQKNAMLQQQVIPQKGEDVISQKKDEYEKAQPKGGILSRIYAFFRNMFCTKRAPKGYDGGDYPLIKNVEGSKEGMLLQNSKAQQQQNVNAVVSSIETLQWKTGEIIDIFKRLLKKDELDMQMKLALGDNMQIQSVKNEKEEEEVKLACEMMRNKGTKCIKEVIGAIQQERSLKDGCDKSLLPGENQDYEKCLRAFVKLSRLAVSVQDEIIENKQKEPLLFQTLQKLVCTGKISAVESLEKQRKSDTNITAKLV